MLRAFASAEQKLLGLLILEWLEAPFRMVYGNIKTRNDDLR